MAVLRGPGKTHTKPARSDPRDTLVIHWAEARVGSAISILRDSSVSTTTGELPVFSSGSGSSPEQVPEHNRSSFLAS